MLDATAFTKALAALPPNDVASVGGRDIIRTMKTVALDGSAPPSRFVVLRFDSAAQWPSQLHFPRPRSHRPDRGGRLLLPCRSRRRGRAPWDAGSTPIAPRRCRWPPRFARS